MGETELGGRRRSLSSLPGQRVLEKSGGCMQDLAQAAVPVAVWRGEPHLEPVSAEIGVLCAVDREWVCQNCALARWKTIGLCLSESHSSVDKFTYCVL